MAKKLRVLIVDDEPLARERVAAFLSSEPDVSVVGEARNGPEAVASIRQLRPNLAFLDVQMPGSGGLEVLRELKPDERPLTIFVTAHDKYAVDAFELRAIDYLLKPLKPARFRDALERAREMLSGDNEGASEVLAAGSAPATNGVAGGAGQSRNAFLGDAREQFLTRIPVRRNGAVTFVPVKDISHVEAAGNYLTLHSGKDMHTVRQTLTALEGELNPRQFIRISRSALVNVNAIKEIQPTTAGDHVMILRSGATLPVTRTIRDLEDLLRFS
jgi:two-component system LytT family response regulator